MSPDARRTLAQTIRTIRARMLDDLKSETERVYRLSVPVQHAGLDERHRVFRGRLESWLAEETRANGGNRVASDFISLAVKQAAYTLVNRLVVLRIMEATGLRAPALVASGWESRAHRDFRSLAPALVRDDITEGYGFLLQLVFDDLAHDLPGLFGPAGIGEVIPIPGSTLREVVEALDEPNLTSCWTDDMTLGWVYQYWNDPDREALDDKLNKRGKLESYEIASKTQMFTERYMVDWLLQNSLGPMWLAMCRKQGWIPEVEADGTLERLEQRRKEWRGKRERGEVLLTAMVPLHTEAEGRWAYYVPQPLPKAAIESAPESVRDLKILDPAVGSGHFLVVAFDLLMALYEEEARHKKEVGLDRWSRSAIVERILSHNLHGIDLDPRAVQIAAAALWLKAQRASPGVAPTQLNLVASNLRLASLPDDDPALVELRREVERETGIPGELTDAIVHALRGADYLGSLLKVDAAVDATLTQHEAKLGRVEPDQGGLWAGFAAKKERVPVGRDDARATVLARLGAFLARHTSAEDLGLRLRGEQLAAGVRFVRIAAEGRYDLVVANPPYQGTSKIADATYVARHYPRGKADLYAAFLERGLQLCREGGTSAMLTMRNWMFIKQYTAVRTWLLTTYDLRALGDFDRGAFEEVPDEVVSVVGSVFHKAAPTDDESVALQPTPLQDRSRDSGRTPRKRAAVLANVGRFTFTTADLAIVDTIPVIYWWSEADRQAYAKAPKFGELYEVRQGLCTGDNTRALRYWWEAPYTRVFSRATRGDLGTTTGWLPFMKGGEDRAWVEPLLLVLNWRRNGLEIKVGHESGNLAARPQNESYYLRRGVAIQATGADFSARIHRYPSIFGDKARSVFPDSIAQVVTILNGRRAREAIESFNPTIDFTVGDLKRVPFYPIDGAEVIGARVIEEFDASERHREASIEFRTPGPAAWRNAQIWAQLAVDRPEGVPLPPFEPVFEQERAATHVSFAVGAALGRFGPTGEGTLDPRTADLSRALSAGVLFLDGTLDENDLSDGLGHPAAKPVRDVWNIDGAGISHDTSLRDWLRTRFFADVHRQMYEDRPIHLPLSSSRKTFVAWVNIHRWDASTLTVLLADHLLDPTLKRLDGELDDLRAIRDGTDKKAAREAERRFDKVLRWRDELQEFIDAVEQCADRGPPPPDAKCPPRKVDARYDPDLDDGVMVNSAALWPLLDPQWSKPKKWWKELAAGEYDWSHLAMRYWPNRVDDACQSDPSLGVAHGCFWKYHPGRAWRWELRLQDEIGPAFRIEEAPYRGDGGHEIHRAEWLRTAPDGALAAIEKEARDRRRRHKGPQPTLAILEPGLWARHAAACWELELRVTEAQGSEFRLLAPDEPEARALFEAQNPDRVVERRDLVSNLAPPPDLFEGGEDDSETADETADAEEQAE